MQATGAGIGGHDEVLATGTVPAARPSATPTNNVAEQGVSQDTTAIPSRGRGRVRGRVQSGGRGRAQGRTRGGQTRMFNYEDPSTLDISTVGRNAPEISLDTPEGQRLKQLVSNCKRYRLQFFNTEDGTRVRLQLHPHLLRQVDESRHCALCGTVFERRQSNFKCATCAVHIFVRVQPAKRTSCWAKWHECKRLDIVRSHNSLPLDKRTKGNADHDSTVPSNSEPESSTRKRISRSTPEKTGPVSTPTRSSKRNAIYLGSSTENDESEIQKRPRKSNPVQRSAAASKLSSSSDTKVHCASGCGRPPLLDASNSAHVCEAFHRPMHAFCVYAPGGELGGEKYEGYGAGGFCKTCSLTVPANST